MDEDNRVPLIREIESPRVPQFFLEKAHRELQEENPVGAIYSYLRYMSNLEDPHDMKLSEQVNLTKLIMGMGSICPTPIGSLNSEVVKCFVSVLNNFPENAILLNAFGLYFFAMEEYGVCRSYFQKAASLGYLPAEKNFLHVIWHLIPRWHFRMLNDKCRNLSYQKAIHKAINAGFKSVYDIGAGCGLLSLIAASVSDDVQVTAFEETRILSNIASNIFKRNKLTTNIKIYTENSNVVKNAPAPCNLIVTEIFDAGVFGESCLESIKHALETFATHSEFKMIPASVRIYVTGFESHEVTRKYRYTESLPELGLENICLVDVEAEPYDSEYLKNKNVRYLTGTKPFLNVDFYDLYQLNELLREGSECVDEIELVCTEQGTVHALAVWFDLNLDEETTISTHPANSGNQCWEQAIFHLKHPVQVAKGEVLKLKPRMVGGQINFGLVSHQSICTNCIEVSQNIIAFLNDVKLVRSVTQAACNEEKHNLKIVDFNAFPLFGFLMAKKGATVYHIYKDERDLRLFNHLMTANDLPSYKFIFIHDKAVKDYIVYLEAPNLVYTDLIQTDGSWSKTELSMEAEEKLACETLPRKIFLNAQLVSSDYLDVCNKVDDNNALNFKIFEEINEYSGSEHPNLESLEHEKHSTVVSFDITDLDRMDFHVEGEAIKDGNCNGILYWFDMQFSTDESNTFSTLDSIYYDKCCTLLHKPKCVITGEKIMFHVMRMEGHLKVYCD